VIVARLVGVVTFGLGERLRDEEAAQDAILEREHRAWHAGAPGFRELAALGRRGGISAAGDERIGIHRLVESKAPQPFRA
jgi:hypothetical protein